MYTDLLTHIQNAQRARKETIKFPYSNMDMAIAEILVKKGFIEAASKKGRMPKRVIEVVIKYNEGKGAIEGVRFLSVPSLRRYAGYENLRVIRQGYGTALISTPSGIMTVEEAKKAKIGGQLLFEIW